MFHRAGQAVVAAGGMGHQGPKVRSAVAVTVSQSSARSRPCTSARQRRVLDRLHAAAAAQDRTGSLIEIGALRALALAAAGEGPPMAALLGRLIAAQRAGQAAAEVPLGYLARLQRAFGPGRPASDPGPSGIVEPLTSRELEVLAMLAAGRSNQAIARELVVTLDTVKKHVGHVLGKLGAANRTEAAARARELSLIP